jgi:putative hydrolase of the HAD superfamily
LSIVQIKAVTLDVGGTLIQPWPSVGHVYAEIAARHGCKNISPELLNVRFKAVWLASKDFDYTRAGWEKLVAQVFQGLTSAPSRPTFFPELYDRFAEPEAWRIFDDVRPALESLAAAGIRLGVISNWDERLRGLLERLRLQDYFETFAISCEVGFPKPSPVIFAQAAAGFGLPPTAILHIGDSLEMDAQGARSAGFRALHLMRDREEYKDDCIDSLAGVAAKVAIPISPR